MPRHVPATVNESSRQANFRAFYEANYARILGYALRRSLSAEDAADAVAETFTIAWQKFEEIPEGEEARFWLYGVARKVLANQRWASPRLHRAPA